MTAEQPKERTSTASAAWGAVGLGFVAFVVGVVLLLKVFGWAYGVFSSIDASLARVATVAPVKAPPTPSVAATPNAGSEGSSGPQSRGTVKARPGGPSLGLIAASIGLKLVGLLILGWIAAMVAARGANMVAAALRQ